MLLGENRFGPSLSVDDALVYADQLGLAGIIAAPARPIDYHLEPANAALVERAQESDGKLAVLGRIDPLDGDRAVALAERCIREFGCVGLFLHPGEEAFPIRVARPVLEVADALGVPTVVATGYFSLSEPLQVAELAADFPAVRIIMTSAGQINISGLSMVDGWLALTTTPNLHVLTNGEYRQDFIERLATELDVGRVLFASFAPLFSAEFEIARIRSARLSGEARMAIEHDNAARLFSIG